MPCCLRAPSAFLRLAKGRTTEASYSRAATSAGTPAANASSRASSYSSGASVSAHQTRSRVDLGEGLQPIPAGIRFAVAQRCPLEGRDPRADRGA